MYTVYPHSCINALCSYVYGKWLFFTPAMATVTTDFSKHAVLSPPNMGTMDTFCVYSVLCYSCTMYTIEMTFYGLVSSSQK